jgi:putative peptidoglycan lipid II flippase
MSRKGLLRSTAVFTSMTFLSRMAGFARDWLQASLFGTNAAVSAFVVAYRIPNYLRRIFAEGSFSSAFVPVLSELKESGDEKALQDFLDHIAGALLAAVMIVTALGILLSPWIARLFLLFADESSATVALTADMLRITFPYLMFISMTALSGSVLNSYKYFGLPAFTPVLHNLSLIAAMLLLARFFDVREFSLAWGVFIAGVAQMILLWPAMARHAKSPHFKFNFKHEGVRRVLKLMLPTIFSSSVSQINLLVGTMFASLLVVQAQSWLYYSDRLVELPLGLFGVAIGTVILPHLSSHHAKKDTSGFSHSIDWGLRLVMLVGMPASLGLILLAEPMTATLFYHGKFKLHDVHMVAASMTAMGLAIPAFMLSKVLLPAFYSRHDTKTPMRAAVYTVIVNVVLTVAIVIPLWRMKFEAAHAGIALATALAGVFNTYLLWRYLMRLGVYQPEKGWRKLILQIIFGLILMAAAVLGIRHLVGDWAEYVWWSRVLMLLGVVLVGAAAYGLALVATGLRPRHLREQ